MADRSHGRPERTAARSTLRPEVQELRQDRRAALRRRVNYWEVWTEPNENFYWLPQNLARTSTPPAGWTCTRSCSRATLALVKPVNSSVKIAIGALTGLGAACCILGTTFLEGMISRGVPFEYLAINPHVSRNQAPWSCIQYTQSFCDIQKIRNILVNRNKSSVQDLGVRVRLAGRRLHRSGTTRTKLRVPGNIYRLALWPNSGKVVVNGATYSYSSINRTDVYSEINLTSALPSTPPDGTRIDSPQAEALHADYVRQSLRMLKGTYTPANGHPQQNYNYVKVAVYFLNYDRATVNFGMFGLFHEPTPNWNQPGKWIVAPRPAASAFKSEAG